MDNDRGTPLSIATVDSVRFDDLFDDLESQLEAELGAEERDVLAEEERFRIGRLEIRDRLVRASSSLDLTLRDGERLRIDKLAVGKDWVSGTVRDGAPDGTGCIVPLHAIRGLRFDRSSLLQSIDPHHTEQPGLTARLSLGYALRDLARRRTWVELRGASVVAGTIDRVGRDHCDVAMHESGLSRREQHVVGYEVVPFAAIDWIRVGE